MLPKLLAGTEWSEFAGYLSPSFVQSMPKASLARQLSKVAGNYLTRRGFAAAKSDASAMLMRCRLPVDLNGDTSAAESDQSITPRARGQNTLVLYFAEILTLDVALLDLRATSFRNHAERLVWSPAPLFISWSAPFIANVRGLYGGFYLGDDQTFRDALRELGLAGAETELRAHFGADQTSLSFRLADFRRSMNAVFSAAVRADAVLAPEMLSLGMALACLYEHLETLGGAFDVRDAYLVAKDLTDKAR